MKITLGSVGVLGWGAVLAVEAGQSPRVQITAETRSSGLEHAIVRRDGAIIVSGQFAGSEGDPFSNLLVLDSGGRLLRRLPPLLYPLEPGLSYHEKYTRCAAALDDGSFIVENGIGLLRLNADGSFDESFNVTYPTNAYTFQTAIQSDGKLLFVSSFDDGLPVRRTFRDGTPDAEFTRQAASASLPPEGVAMALSSNGKIWLYARGGTNEQLVKLNSDGSRDLGFSAPAFIDALSLVPQPDGKLLVARRVYRTPKMVRLNEDGSLDTSFSLDPDLLAGLAGVTSSTIVGKVALTPSGRIVISIEHPASDDSRLKRLLPDGRLDPAFNEQRPLGWLVELISLPDEKLLAIYSHDWEQPGNLFARLNPDGSVDAAFDASAATASYISAVGVDIIFAGARRGFRYAVETSTDLRTWTTVYTSGPLTFNPTGEFHGFWSDADAGRFGQRLYRGVVIAP